MCHCRLVTHPQLLSTHPLLTPLLTHRPHPRKETTHLLSTAEFDLLRPNRTFVTNISRGAIVDQDALITALQNNTLRGAALDVTHPEPLPQDSPLWEMDNVVITPHISGIGVNYTERAFQILDINLERRERREQLINVVDRRRGYGRN